MTAPTEKDIRYAFEEVVREYQRAKTIFPERFHSRHEAYAVVLEEMDELWETIKHNEPVERIREEAVQVAAMVMQFLAELEEKE